MPKSKASSNKGGTPTSAKSGKDAFVRGLELPVKNGWQTTFKLKKPKK
jgi:hypothetical protein